MLAAPHRDRLATRETVGTALAALGDMRGDQPMKARAPLYARRSVRELVGWTILAGVIMASKLAVWLDGLVTGGND
jgi:hypothetical protein